MRSQRLTRWTERDGVLMQFAPDMLNPANVVHAALTEIGEHELADWVVIWPDDDVPGRVVVDVIDETEEISLEIGMPTARLHERLDQAQKLLDVWADRLVELGLR